MPYDISTFSTGNPVNINVPPTFDPGVQAKEPRRFEQTSNVNEKLKSGVPIPAFLPWYDQLQSIGETQEMRMSYRMMLNDPTVKAAVLQKIFSVMALDLVIKPPKHLKNDKRSKQIAEFNDWNFKEGIRGGVPELVWSILSGGLIDGFSLCEKVRGQVEQKGRWKGKRRLAALKPKDPDQDFVVDIDEFRNDVGVRGLRYNSGETFDPKEFVFFRNLQLFGNPGGMSDFRAAYGKYWIKDTAWKLRAQALSTRATPMIVGSFKDATTQSKLDASLARAKSQNWISAPEDAKITALNISGQADQIFDSTIKALSEEIAISIVGSLLTSTTSDGQRGDSNVHKDTADLRGWQLSAAILAILNDHENGLIRENTDHNFAGVDEYPTAAFGGIDDAELKESLAVDEGLQRIIQPQGYQLVRDELEDRYGRTFEKIPPQPMQPGMPGAPGAPPGAGGALAPPGGISPGGADFGNGGDPNAPPAAGGGVAGDPAGAQGQVDGTPESTAPVEQSQPQKLSDYLQGSDQQDDMGDPKQRADLMADILGGAMGGDDHALDAMDHGDGQHQRFGEHHDFDETNWTRDVVGKSQRRWRNVHTGAIEYSDQNPGGTSSGSGAASSAAAPRTSQPTQPTQPVGQPAAPAAKTTPSPEQANATRIAQQKPAPAPKTAPEQPPARAAATQPAIHQAVPATAAEAEAYHKQNAASSRPDEDKPLLGKVATVKELGGGVNGAQAVTMSDGSKGVWKSAASEAPDLRQDIAPGTYYRRETAASQIAGHLGMNDLVPATVTREINGQHGSVQAFVPNASQASVISNEFDGEKDHVRSAAFDYLIAQTDRHFGNWMLTHAKEQGGVKGLFKKAEQWLQGGKQQGEKIKLIDNGLSMPRKEQQRHFQAQELLRGAVHKKIPDLSAWEGKWGDVEKAMKGNGIEDDAIGLAKNRFDALIKGSKEGKTFADLPYAGATIGQIHATQPGAFRVIH